MSGSFRKERVVEVGRLLADLRRCLCDRICRFWLFEVLVVVELGLVRLVGVVKASVLFCVVVGSVGNFRLDRASFALDVLAGRRLGPPLLARLGCSANENLCMSVRRSMQRWGARMGSLLLRQPRLSLLLLLALARARLRDDFRCVVVTF